ncbi:MAG: hypothetical protein MUC29_05500 [Pyrinomonadaceae bacterium]|nr:hypothetical protein [Pyrinomonadaceae bacterium]
MKKLLLFTFLMASFTLATTAQKMTADEVIKKHLDSIGKAEDRAKIKNQAILGNFKFTLPLRKDLQYTGTIAFAGEGAKRLFGMNFNQETKPDYNTERIIYNEKDVKIGNARFNQRSALGEFIFRNDRILKDGLLGGALFNTWALSSLDLSKAKINYDGKKKVNGIEAHALEYNPKKGFGVTIKLFFDATTFQHIRTEYRRTIGAQIGPTPEASAGQSETKETLTEDFSDFKTETLFTLPHKYKITFESSGRSTTEFRYELELNQFYFNQDLGADPFELNTK